MVKASYKTGKGSAYARQKKAFSKTRKSKVKYGTYKRRSSSSRKSSTPIGSSPSNVKYGSYAPKSSKVNYGTYSPNSSHKLTPTDFSQSSGRIDVGQAPPSKFQKGISEFKAGFSGEQSPSGVIANPSDTPTAYAAGALAGIIPFSISSKLINTNKYTKIGKSALDRIKIGQMDDLIKQYAKGSVAQNTKTLAKTKRYIDKVMIQLKKPPRVASMVSASILMSVGSYPWAAHLRIDNALGTYKMGIRDAIDNGFPKEAQRIREARDEFLNPSWVDKLLMATPIINVLHSAYEELKAAKITSVAYDKAIEEALNPVEGESTADAWIRRDQLKEEGERATIDYYNASRKEMLKWEENATDRDDLEDAEMWREERKKTYKDEKEQRELQAEFWIEYRKTILEMELEQQQKINELYNKQKANTAPSKLNFGLL